MQEKSTFRKVEWQMGYQQDCETYPCKTRRTNNKSMIWYWFGGLLLHTMLVRLEVIHKLQEVMYWRTLLLL